MLGRPCVCTRSTRRLRCCWASRCLGLRSRTAWRTTAEASGRGSCVWCGGATACGSDCLLAYQEHVGCRCVCGGSCVSWGFHPRSGSRSRGGGESDSEVSHDGRSTRPWCWQALGVRPFFWQRDDALHTAGCDAGAWLLVWFAVARVCAFTGRRVGHCVDRAKIVAAGTPMSGERLRRRQSERDLPAALWVAVVRALHVA
jgi:hypothetical protein